VEKSLPGSSERLIFSKVLDREVGEIFGSFFDERVDDGFVVYRGCEIERPSVNSYSSSCLVSKGRGDLQKPMRNTSFKPSTLDTQYRGQSTNPRVEREREERYLLRKGNE